MKNNDNIIWNRTHDLPACSAMPQPSALQRAPNFTRKILKIHNTSCKYNNMNIVATMLLTYYWLQFIDTPLFTKCVEYRRLILNNSFIDTNLIHNFYI